MKCRIVEYIDFNGRSVFGDWFMDLDASVAARIDRYVRRMERGNFGNSRSVGTGVYELKVDVGPGYRVYYGREGSVTVILLGGGDKGHQSRDIRQAIESWASYKKRKE